MSAFEMWLVLAGRALALLCCLALDVCVVIFIVREQWLEFIAAWGWAFVCLFAERAIANRFRHHFEMAS